MAYRLSFRRPVVDFWYLGLAKYCILSYKDVCLLPILYIYRWVVLPMLVAIKRNAHGVQNFTSEFGHRLAETFIPLYKKGEYL